MRSSGRAFLTAVLALALAASWTTTRAASPAIERVVVFGDSNVDSGNLFHLYRRPAPPAWRGRSSNGPNVADYLVERLHAAMENYAVSGATTGKRNLLTRQGTSTAAAIQIPGLESQLEQFARTGRRLTDGDVVVIWAGSNDIKGVQREDRGALDLRIASVTRNSESALLWLHAMGARRIVVANRTPREELDSDNDLNGLDLNRAIAETVTHAVAITGADIRLFDAYAAIADMMRNPARYGFTHPTAQCVKEPACAGERYDEGLTLGVQYVNWDTAHKTTRVHQLMAEQIATMLER